MEDGIVSNNDITVNSDILVVDDSIVVLAVVRNILESKYNIRTAPSAKEAQELMEEKIPDLILLDLEMPEMNGLAFFSLIKDDPRWADIPVIFLTGVDDRKKEEHALALGAVEYILKPISEGILLKRVHFHLELRIYRKSLEKMVLARTEELLKTQEELQIAADTAKAALRDKSAFLANMSHELKTPMNSIMGMTEAALTGELSPEFIDYFSNIKNSTRILLRVINDILDISKIEAGKMEIENISFNPISVLSNCQTMIENQITEKGILFKIDIDGSLRDKQFSGDPVRLYQAILNLLSNAAKFTESGTISLSARQLESNDEYSVLHFEVQDTGIGMAQEHLDRVYEPFVQVGNEVTRFDTGTGLGLPITKSIVELMGGTLTAESRPGIGSTFRIEIRLPVTKADSLFDNVFGESVPESATKPQFNGEILVCEDDDVSRKVICEHLRRVGIDTVVAENGLEGLRIVIERTKNAEKPFDLILMDMQMPVMDGYEAAARINALGTGTPVVALVANIMAGDLENYKRNGLMDCIGKPFQTWDLWRCLLSFMMPVKNTEEFKILAEERARAAEAAGFVDSAAGKDASSAEAGAGGIAEKKGILIVDDEKSNIIALTHFLRDEYSVYVTRDSRDAAEMAEEHIPDIILLDIIMPEMDGYEVITKLKKSEKTRDIPVVFISGLTTPDAMVKGLALGAADYIAKPFESSLVKSKIKRLLAQ
ncbi:MAG: response regulator [Oscillospiraceae bacterium]|nr:response regulator [Oscillospiraceae bacterium]